MACAYRVIRRAAEALVTCQDPFARARMYCAIAENGVEPGPECASHFNNFGECTVATVAGNPTGNLS